MTDQELLEHCAEAGLALDGVSWRDELLVLRPQSYDQLPSPAELARLGEELKRRTSARWVSIDIDALAEES